MKRSNVLAAILGGLMLLAMLPAQAIIVVASPNATLPDGSPGFNLVRSAIPHRVQCAASPKPQYPYA